MYRNARRIPHFVAFLAVFWGIIVGAYARQTIARKTRPQCIWLEERSLEN